MNGIPFLCGFTSDWIAYIPLYRLSCQQEYVMLLPNNARVLWRCILERLQLCLNETPASSTLWLINKHSIIAMLTELAARPSAPCGKRKWLTYIMYMHWAFPQTYRPPCANHQLKRLQVKHCVWRRETLGQGRYIYATKQRVKETSCILRAGK